MTWPQRHKPMKRSKLLARTALSRGKPLTRKGRVKPRNGKRKAEQFARNFGDEAEAVRAMPCRLSAVMPPQGLGWDAPGCKGDIVAAHVVSRGASGGRFDLIPLCQHHHDEQHAVGVETFAASYGLDLRAEADRVALAHSEPNGLRPVAARWLWWMLDLGEPFASDPHGEHGLAWSLCEAAGWPS
jgi:hypothetical protein